MSRGEDSDLDGVAPEVMAERVRGLVAMAAADGRVGRREVRLIEALCQRWGADPALLASALADAEQGRTRVVVPSQASERKLLLKGLVQVAAADGVIEPGERQMLEAFAQRVGLDSIALEQLVQRALAKRRAGKADKAGKTDQAEVAARGRRPASDERVSDEHASDERASDARSRGGERPSGAGRRPRSEEELRRLRDESDERRRLGSGRRAVPEAAALRPPAGPPPPLPVVAGGFVTPPPQRPMPAHSEAVSCGLDPKGPEVYGEPPWGERPGPLRRCDACLERVPERMRVCPFCELPTRAKADPLAPLRAIDFGSPAVRLAAGLLLVGGILVSALFVGRFEGDRERALAESLAEVFRDPSPQELEEARRGERERQEQLRKEVEALAAQVAQAKAQRADARVQLEALGKDPALLLREARARRSEEFHRLFPEAR
ncbi:MAG: TerB family tellurite resistance protein [Planctomycetota bacterium]